MPKSSSWGWETLAMPVRVAVRRMREQGIKVGFCADKVVSVLSPPQRSGKSCLASKPLESSTATTLLAHHVMQGCCFHEIRSGLYPLEKRPLVISFIAGLGGREIRVNDVTHMTDIIREALETGTVEQEKIIG